MLFRSRHTQVPPPPPPRHHPPGTLKYLQERLDLTRRAIPFSGASAGAILSALAACGVSADWVYQKGVEFCLKHNVYSRFMLGKWGDVLEEVRALGAEGVGGAPFFVAWAYAHKWY